MEVRGYELDSFGHVNHAAYISYLEHARWKMLYEEGVTLEKFPLWKRWPIVHKVEATYLKPTYLGEELDVHTWIVDHGKTYFVLKQTIFRKNVPVVEAQIQAVMIDEKGRPARLPDEVHRLWTERDHGGIV